MKTGKQTSINEKDAAKPGGDAAESKMNRPDYKVALLSLAGTVGFIIGFVILFCPDLKRQKSIFHEISYHPRALAQNLIETSVNRLADSIGQRETKTLLNNDTIRLYNDSIAALAKRSQPVKEPEVKRNALLTYNRNTSSDNKRDSGIIRTLLSYKPYYESDNLSDTLAFNKLNKALHFDISPDTLCTWDCRYDTENTAWTSEVNYYFKDEDIPFSAKGKATFGIQPFDSNIAFITKYPDAGIWLLLILVLCSFAGIAIVQCCYLGHEIVHEKHKNKIGPATTSQYYILSLTILFIMILLTLIWIATFYDDTVIKNIFFLKTITLSFIHLTVFGYIAGALCLAGFVYTTAMITCTADSLQKKKIKLIAEEAAFEADKEKKALKQDIEKLKSEIGDNKIAYNNLVKYFNTYFILSATILSLMVLCTGALFNTVASIDFIKLLESDWGYSPARPDFVYLYAGIYTVILLLVYVPGRMRFNETKALFADEKTGEQAPQATGANDKSNDGSWLSLLKDPFSNLKGVLLATSPLLTGIIQMLLDMLFKG